MVFTLPGLIFNIIGVLAIMRSEWLQNQASVGKHEGDLGSDQTEKLSSFCSLESDLDAAFSLWMLGGLALVFGFCLHIAALFS